MTFHSELVNKPRLVNLICSNNKLYLIDYVIVTFSSMTGLLKKYSVNMWLGSYVFIIMLIFTQPKRISYINVLIADLRLMSGLTFGFGYRCQT